MANNIIQFFNNDTLLGVDSFKYVYTKHLPQNINRIFIKVGNGYSVTVTSHNFPHKRLSTYTLSVDTGLDLTKHENFIVITAIK